MTVIGPIILAAIGIVTPLTHTYAQSCWSSDTSSRQECEKNMEPYADFHRIQEYESGFCQVDGSIDSNHGGYTGSGFANTFNSYGAGITWNIHVSQAGNYLFQWAYANAAGLRTADFRINDTTVASINQYSSGDWTTWWTTDTVTTYLSQGEHTISLVSTNSEGLANIDWMSVSGSSVSRGHCNSDETLPQTGNPAQSRYERARTKWSRNRADIVLSYQYNNGGWPKNLDYNSPGNGGSGLGTFDNGATVTEIVYLAQVYQDTGDYRYAESVRRAMNFIFSAQYSKGGWPQFYPLRGGYSDHVTFNDNAMASILMVLHNASQRNAPFLGNIFSESDRGRMKTAINKGIDYILKSQWRQNGDLTVWCAQHGKDDYLPKKARAYELESLSGSESVEIVGFLMSQPQTPQVKSAVQAALRWFRSPETKLENYAYDKSTYEKIVYRPGATMWYRFYDLYSNRGFFSDRDSRKVYNILEISEERREGYSWGGNYGQKIIDYANRVGY